jgi:hypothetical protein
VLSSSLGIFRSPSPISPRPTQRRRTTRISKHRCISKIDTSHVIDLTNDSPIPVINISDGSPIRADLTRDSPIPVIDVSDGSPIQVTDLSRDSPIPVIDLTQDSPRIIACLTTDSPDDTDDLTKESRADEETVIIQLDDEPTYVNVHIYLVSKCSFTKSISTHSYVRKLGMLPLSFNY